MVKLEDSRHEGLLGKEWIRLIDNTMEVCHAPTTR